MQHLSVAATRTIVGFLMLALTGCGPRWQAVRLDVIDPIQELLHRRYPAAIESGDTRRVSALFETPAASWGIVAVMERFEHIEAARAVIDDARWEPDRVHAQITLQIEGLESHGEPLHLRQQRQVTSARTADGWRIATDAGGAVTEVRPPGPRFADETAARGLDFTHAERWHPDRDGVLRRYVFGSGPSVDDVDGDGWEDAVLVNGDRVELFLNRAGRFTKASKAWGLGEPLEGSQTASLLTDFDGDRRPDLFVGALYGQPSYYRNTGTRFERRENSGLVTEERVIAACAADFDGDGDVDLFVANNEDPHQHAPAPMGFADNARADQLFLNRGDGTFHDATAESGITNTGWSLACAAADYDDDGDVDLFVGNDFGDDVLYENDGAAHFRDATRATGAAASVASMSADWGDYDGDGDFDLFVGGMSSASDWAIDHPAFPAPAPWIFDLLFRDRVREAVRSFFHGNRLFENRGDGTFREVSLETGTVNSGWAWSSVWLDFDNDGLLDLYSSNGMISGPIEDDL
jgi:hypothetical protein